jgi:hypothetical protein
VKDIQPNRRAQRKRLESKTATRTDRGPMTLKARRTGRARDWRRVELGALQPLRPRHQIGLRRFHQQVIVDCP